MKESLDLFISTGEMSGDALASSIVKHLPKDLAIGGIVGPKLREMGAKEYFPMELFEVHGVTALIKSLPRILKNYFKIKKKIIELNPKVVLLVDNMEFSMFMANSLRKAGYKGKIVQLVCPTVWAWRAGRMKKMIKNLDLVLSLFPHEPEIFAKTTLAVEFIGHPLAENLLSMEHTPAPKKTFALFPGSRRAEIGLNLPIQIRAAKQIENDYTPIISAAKESFIPLIEKIMLKEGVKYEIAPPKEARKLMGQADLALAKCGTTIFELGILGTPTIVMYKMNKVDLYSTYAAGVLLPHYALPNILMGSRIYPEHIGFYAVEKNIIDEVVRVAHSEGLKKRMRDELKQLQEIYREKAAASLGAEKIRNLL